MNGRNSKFKTRAIALGGAFLLSGWLLARFAPAPAQPDSSLEWPPDEIGTEFPTEVVADVDAAAPEHWLMAWMGRARAANADVHASTPLPQNGIPDGCLAGLPGIDLSGEGSPEAGRALQEAADLVRQGIQNGSIQLPDLTADRALLRPRQIRPLPPVEGPSDVHRDPSVQPASHQLHEELYKGLSPSVPTTSAFAAGQPGDCVDPHAAVFRETLYPSARECAQCHQQIYDEWASSSHAYAAVSPMFQRFEDTINQLSQGTIGYFCMRCHAPVATTTGLRRDQPIWDGPHVLREGVTCVACHRVKVNYTKSNGERRIEPGTLYDPVYGATDSTGSQIVAKYKDFFKVKVSPADPATGQPLHTRTIEFEQLSQSDFCMSCHQVAVQPGIKLEVVWDQYRASPAYREGTTCQDCHMGMVPGKADGYSIGPAALVDGKAVHPDRKHSNHMFFGPGYSVAHPGVFPFHAKGDRWSFNAWLEFDWRAGWGTPAFEDAVASGAIQPWFPPAWCEPDDRIDARMIIDENLGRLMVKKDLRRQVLENGSRIDGPFFQCDPVAGEPIRFHYCVTNTNPGHNLPSGSLGAQPQLWLNVVLIDPDGNRVWESGYLDSQGDLADMHSSEVLERRAPLDKQLFNLQTKFLTTNVKGTDREMYLPINVDVDQLPFIRPDPRPVSVLNHPALIRMEAHSLPPLGSRKAKYVIPADLVTRPGTWRLSVRLRSRAEPVYFMKFVKASPETIRMMNEWIVDAHPQSILFQVR